MDEAKPIKLDEKTARTKAEHYCAYQDRAQQEVRDKLYSWGLWPDAVERIISELISDNFLNEERFARAYVHGKFTQKGWGQIKIKQGLKFKRIPDTLIKKALLQLDAHTYLETLGKLLAKKAPLIREKDASKRRYKLQQYAMSRGYENDLIADVLKASDL